MPNGLIEKKMNKIFYTKIEVNTLCKNGSERFGANASCMFSNCLNKKFFEANMHGSTKEEAKIKLIKFLSSNGEDQVEEVNQPYGLKDQDAVVAI